MFNLSSILVVLIYFALLYLILNLVHFICFFYLQLSVENINLNYNAGV
jgi:hypothetical protein